MSQDRTNQIGQILLDLRIARTTTTDKDKLYAIDENIIFFEATKSFPRYLWWVFSKMNKIDPKRLLEINDILPKWDREMHIKLMEVEKRKYPGLIKPLVDAIIEFIKKKNRPLVLVDIGFGGMETERQVLERLIADKFRQRVIFVGIDQSSSAHEIARDNLKTLVQGFQYYQVDILNNKYLEDLRKENNGFAVVACKNNIFDLDKIFPEKMFDLSYHSLFKHHLADNQQQELDRITSQISKKRFEYDGFRNIISMIPQTKNGWAHPAFLNAAIFSNLRFGRKQSLTTSAKDKGKITFYKHTGNYLLEYS